MNLDIKKILEQVDLNDNQSVVLAASKLLEAAVKLSAGTRVTLIDPEGAHGCPYVGAVGKVKGPSKNGEGWYMVEFNDGSIHHVQANLLLPLK